MTARCASRIEQAREGRSAGSLWLLLALPLQMLAGSSQGAETAAVPRSPPQELDLAYEIYAGGLHAFSADAQVSLGVERYDMTLQLRTDGWLSWLLTFTLDSEVSGRADAQGLQPDRFRTASVWRDRERSVEVDYQAAALPVVEAVPPPEEDDRDPVPDELRLGAVDPLSAGLGLVHRLGATERCGGEAAVFDGRRLFRATARHIGTAALNSSSTAPYGGSATACRLTVKPVTGFWKKQDTKIEPKDVTVYFRPVIEGGPPVPVRVEADSRFGAVRIHLVDARAGAGTN